MPTYPIAHEYHWSEPTGKGFHINMTGHLTRTGQMYIQVNTNTNSWGLGFTGGSSVMALAADGTVVWVSKLYTAGVDAKSVFWGRSSRTDVYLDQLTPDGFQKVESLQFLAGHTPRDRWMEDWKKIEDGAGVALKTTSQVITQAAAIISSLTKG